MVSREDDRLIYSDANRRIDISSSRDSLNGYQKGRCFYCDGMISLENNSENFCDVDHLLPHMLCHASPFKQSTLMESGTYVSRAEIVIEVKVAKVARYPTLDF